MGELQIFDFVGGVVLLCSCWVAYDASKIGVRKGAIPGFFNMGVVGWFFSCLLLFIVAFPAYLIKRPQYLSGPVLGASDLDRLTKLVELRDRGALTEEEFQAQKRKLGLTAE